MTGDARFQTPGERTWAGGAAGVERPGVDGAVDEGAGGGVATRFPVDPRAGHGGLCAGWIGLVEAFDVAGDRLGCALFPGGGKLHLPDVGYGL